MKVVDGLFKEWGERIDYGLVPERKGRNVAGGRYQKPAPASARRQRADVAAAVHKSPEVIVKISGGAKGLRGLKAHFDYISRNGELALEDEQQRIHLGKDSVRDARDDWTGTGIPYDDGKYKQAFNIILSMPPGTDRDGVRQAASDFAAELFGRHQYLFAAHNDEKHPHVHLVVRAVDKDGIRLNPRKADLQHWRQTFAERLRDRGIEANATPRRARGIVLKAEKQAILHMDRGHAAGQRDTPARITAARERAAHQAARGGPAPVNPAEQQIAAARQTVQHAYGQLARALGSGEEEDRRLALKIVGFVQQMPGLETRHERRVQALRARTGPDQPSHEPSARLRQGAKAVPPSARQPDPKGPGDSGR